MPQWTAAKQARSTLGDRYIRRRCKQSFARVELNGWLSSDSAAEVVDQEYWRCFTGDLWTHGELLRLPVRASGPHEDHQLTCLSIRRHLRSN